MVKIGMPGVQIGFVNFNYFVMSKKLWIFIGVGVVAVLFLFSLLLSNRLTPTNQSNGGATTTGATLDIPTPAGDVKINDITQNPIQQVPDNIVFERSEKFSIVYYPEEKTFSINILAQPLKQSRDQAEAALLKDLGISVVQACKLTVTMFVPFDVDENLAGQDLGLSFCPSGKGL